MARITRAEVEHIAELARLSLAPGEAERMTADLATILDYVERLERADTAGVEPTAHPVSAALDLRDDEPRESLPTEAVVANAPRHDAAAFIVPKVIEGEEG